MKGNPNADPPGLFDELDERTGKLRTLQQRTGLGWPPGPRKRPTQRHLAGKIDPRLSECLATLRRAVEEADREALTWVICAAAWWLLVPELQELGGVLAKLLEGESC